MRSINETERCELYFNETLSLSLSEFQDRWMTEGWGRVLEVSVFSTDRYLKAYGFV